MKQDMPPRTAARRLAAELKLPSRIGAVLCAFRSEGPVLVVAADEIWRRHHKIPLEFCGYPVEGDDPIDAIAH